MIGWDSHSSMYFLLSLPSNARAGQRLKIIRERLRASLLSFCIFEILSSTYRKRMNSDKENNQTLIEFLSEEQFNFIYFIFLREIPWSCESPNQSFHFFTKTVKGFDQITYFSKGNHPQSFYFNISRDLIVLLRDLIKFLILSFPCDIYIYIYPNARQLCFLIITTVRGNLRRVL